MLMLTKAFGVILVNFIVYFAFGSLLVIRKKSSEWSLTLAIITGFFAYYALFFVCCMPIMIPYEPLSVLATVWPITVGVIVVLSIILNGKKWLAKGRFIWAKVKAHPVLWSIGLLLVLAEVVVVVCSYDFTLDAAYYVANVSTSVDTNMINVYDPFTGAWQDHFELRYFFATYSIQDAVVCAITGLPALVQTKLVMAATVLLLSFILYYAIAEFFFASDKRKKFAMFAVMCLMNLFNISLYTSSNFLMTRTYEGKAIVGNLALLAVFYMFLLLVRGQHVENYFLILFAICCGTSTISSSANMLIPAQISVLYLPYIFINKRFSMLKNYFVTIIPALCMMLLYVVYVNGYFAIMTYPIR